MLSPSRLASAASRLQSSDLWQKALDRLEDDVKSSLIIPNSPKQDVLAAVHRVAEDRKQLCLRKRWKFKKANGEEIILRDLYDKILVWLDRFKGIGDIAMQYDAGHAALPWAAVRFLLNVAVSEQRIYGMMVEGLEVTTRLIVRCAIVEGLYLRRPSAAHAEFEAALVLLYTDILDFLGEAVKFFKQTLTIREKMKHAVQATALQPVEEDTIRKMTAQEAKVMDLARLIDAEIGQDTSTNVTAVRNLLTKLEAPMERLTQQMNASFAALQEDERLEVLRWLSPVPFVRLHEAQSENRIPNTGTWLANHSQFRKWDSESSSSILLLHGIPGSGKTAVTSAVVDSFLSQKPGQASSTRLAYFYCTKNVFETERSDPDEILRSILRQLTFTRDPRPTVHEALVIDYRRRKAEAKGDSSDVPKLRVAQCVQMILEITGTDPAVLVIDAIDEVQETRRHELIDALVRIASESTSVVKIFVTSRSDINIFALLPEVRRICIDGSDTRADMELFVSHHIDRAIRSKRLRNGNVQDALREDLTQALLVGANEMFLWVILQVENICRLKLEVDIKRATQRLSHDSLEHLYAESYRFIHGLSASARSVALRAVSWLLSSREALTPAAFLAAVRSPDSEDSMDYLMDLDLSQLCDICCNLVVLDTKMNTVRFAHISVQEFFESKAEFAGSSVHRSAAISCLNMCVYNTPPNFDSGLRLSQDFAHYACLYWPEHCMLALAEKKDSTLDQKLRELVYEDEDLSLWFAGWLDDVQRFRSHLANDHPLKRFMNAVTSAKNSPVFTACAFGLTSLLDHIHYDASFDWNMKSESGHTGLYLASTNGHESIVRTLIAHGADVNVMGGRYIYPLHAAVFAGHTSIVQILLDEGAHVRSRGTFDSPCQAAFFGCHEDLAVMLLEKYYELSSKEDYDYVMQQAAEAGFTKVFDLLTKKYPSFDNNATHSKIVEAAIFKGQIGAVDRLLRKSIHTHHELPLSAVSMAAVGGHNSILNLLLDTGLEIEREGPFGSPLRAASLLGHESTVRILLSRGAKVNSCGDLGTALQASSSKGFVSITRLLIQEGADVNTPGGTYGNALQAAAYHGHYAVVEMLLDAGARVNQAGLSKDAMHAAAEGGQDRIVHFLLDRGFEFSYPQGHPFCRKSAPDRHKNLLREESPSRRKPDLHSYQRWTASAESGISPFPARSSISSEGTIKVDVYRTLPSLYHKHWKDCENYALLVAAAKGHAGIVKSLLDQIDNTSPAKSPDSDALKVASENGHAGIVNILIDSKLDMRPYSTAAIEAAAKQGHVAIVGMLLGYKCANQSASSLGPRQRQLSDHTSVTSKADHNDIRIILEAGCRGGHTAIITQALALLHQHCTAEEIMAMERSAFLIAIQHKKPSAADLLLQECTSLSPHEIPDAFVEACREGFQSILGKIFGADAHKAIQGEQYRLGVIAAAAEGHHDMVVDLLAAFNPDDALFLTSFIIVAGNGYIDIMKSLLGRGKMGRRYQETLNLALNIASCKGHGDVVTLLIGEGADVAAHLAKVPRSPHDVYGSLSSTSSMEHEYSCALRDAIKSTQSVWELAMPHKPWRRASPEMQKATVDILLEADATGHISAGGLCYPLHLLIENCASSVIQRVIHTGVAIRSTAFESKDLLEAAARREMEAATVLDYLLQAGASLPTTDVNENEVLNTALAFFQRPRTDFTTEGRFVRAPSIKYVLNEGPGGVIKRLLAVPSGGQLQDVRFGLLLQMAAVAEDHRCVQMLLDRRLDVNSQGYYYGTALQAAARVGSMATIRLLLDAGANVNVLKGAHGTAIRAAVRGDHLAVVDLLAKHGADFNLYDHKCTCAVASRNYRCSLWDTKHQPILQLAVRNGNEAMVGTLLRYGVEINASVGFWSWGTDHGDASPLHTASAKGHTNIVRVLIAHGAEVDKRVESSRTPLQVAASWGHLAVVQQLIEAGANVDDVVSGHTALALATRNGHYDVVQVLLHEGASIAKPPQIPNSLDESCLHRQYATLDLLLMHLSLANIEESVYTETVATALRFCDEKALRMLLSYGLILHSEMLYQACGAGFEYGVKTLIDQGANIHAVIGDGGQAIHVAASLLRPRVVQHLIRSGADVNSKNTHYGSPIIAALEGCMARILEGTESAMPLHLYRYKTEPQLVGQMRRDRINVHPHITKCHQIVEALVESGASIDCEPRGFGKPLLLASFLGKEDTVHLLLREGADANSVGGHFHTPVLAAVAGRHTSIVKILLDNGADMDCSDSAGRTPLQVALSQGDRSTVQLLLDSGADVNAQDGSATTALSSAITWDLQRSRIQIKDSLTELLLSSAIRVIVHNCDLVAAASNETYMKMLLEYDESVQPDEGTVLHAISIHSSAQALKLLLERSRGLSVSAAMLKAALKPQTMEVLLQHPRVCPISLDIFEAAAADLNQPRRLVSLLLANDAKAAITESVVLAVLKSRSFLQEPGLIQRLLDRNKDLVITEPMLKEASCARDMQALLNHSPAVSITPEIIETAAKKTSEPATLVETLLAHGKTFDIDPMLFSKIMTSCKNFHFNHILQVILQHNPQIDITPEIFLKCLDLRYDSAFSPSIFRQRIDTLLQYDKKIPFTEAVRQAIESKLTEPEDQEVKEVCYKLAKDDT